MKKSLLLFLVTIAAQLSLQAQTLISATYLGSKTKSEMATQYFILPVENGVKYYKITYGTPDAHGNPSVASALLAVPDVKTKTFPLLCYQHGTSSSKTDVPSNLNQESALPILFAALGYMTVTPDYIGLGDSPGFHPYVHAASEASAGADALRAVKDFADDEDFCFENRVFLTGYSQGGHASAALHRLLDQTDEFNVVAAAHLSGPYNISGVMRDLLFADEAYSRPAYLINTMFSYQFVYGNLYNDLSDVVKPPYVAKCNEFYNGQISLSQLNDFLIAELTANEGAAIPGRVFRDEFKAGMDADPNHPANIALAANDVMDWAPTAPTRLFYCVADDQVPYENSLVAEAAIQALGAPNFDAIDLGNFNHVGCVTPALIATVTQIFEPNQGTLQPCTIILGTEEKADLPFRIFPNPATDAGAIDHFPGTGELLVSDVQGHVLLRKQLAEGAQSVSLDGLNAGLYFLNFSTEAGRFQSKLVVRK
ncbi:MAG: T9SS type A sorting domain-containing protein [Saprospiraceae bacterium]|nr:T9SS type A sorting domain-containing protein [Saprospiraceae bacterium]